MKKEARFAEVTSVAPDKSQFEQRRWCRGVCERELPLDAFEPRPGGYRRWTCRVCRRRTERVRGRRRYHSLRHVRTAAVARARAYYWSHADVIRARRRQDYWLHKLAGAAA